MNEPNASQYHIRSESDFKFKFGFFINYKKIDWNPQHIALLIFYCYLTDKSIHIAIDFNLE